MFFVIFVCPRGDPHVTTTWIFSLGDPQPWPQIPLPNMGDLTIQGLPHLLDMLKPDHLNLDRFPFD